MLEDIVTNIIAGAACTFLAYMARSLIKFLTTPPPSQSSNIKYSKKSVRNQFLVTLFSLVIFLLLGVVMPMATMWLFVLKLFLFFAAGFSFLFLWGAFDAAFAFYPDDDAGQNEPADNKPDQARKE